MGSVEEKVRAIERVDGMLGTLLDDFDGVIAAAATTRPRYGSGRTRASPCRWPSAGSARTARAAIRSGRRRRETSGGSKRRRSCRSCSGGCRLASAPLHHHESVGVTLIICRPGPPAGRAHNSYCGPAS